VAPSAEDGPDGRRWFEFELEPGASATDHLAVTNLSADPVVFAMQAADGYTTQKGRFSILSNPADSVDSGTWIEIQPEVEVPPGQQVVVPFTVRVPRDATPGDHPAGLAAVVARVGDTEGGAGVNLSSRFAVAVMARVAGELEPKLEIVDARADYRMAWGLLEPGRLAVAFTLVNSGNTRLTVRGSLDVGGPSAKWPAEGEVIGLMPGESREVAVNVRRVWPLFRVTADIVAEPTVELSAGGDKPPEAASATAKASAWALPVPHMIVLAVIALAVMAALRARRATQRKLREAVAAAAAQGRAEALAGARGGAFADLLAEALHDDEDGLDEPSPIEPQTGDDEQADDEPDEDEPGDETPPLPHQPVRRARGGKAP
jgi:hypothetical protein